MNKINYLIALALTLSACNQAKTTEDKIATEQQETVQTKSIAEEKSFAVEALPLSTADIGDFPFFSAPEGAKYINNVKVKPFDFIVAVTENKIFEVEGKVFRAWIHGARNSDTEISNRYLLKSYNDAIIAAGGVKVFEGSLKDDRLKEYQKLVTYAGDDGSFTPSGNNEIVTYVMRREDGNVYITLEKKGFAGSSFQIVQEKPFKQTIKQITADEIVKDLSEKGKSILYINFDIDKANVTTDGKSVVAQIAAALKKEPTLKIAIEGHTDNSGEGAHNKTLSNNRAQSVMQLLTGDGIDQARLSAAGFGAERPLVANDSEENKAKNRRVELINVK